jgi:hypothetical protein
MEAAVESRTGWIITGVLGFVGVTNLVVSSAILHRNAENTGFTPENAAAIAYAFADSVAVFGLLAGVLTSWPFVSIPFGVVAIGGWANARNFLYDRYRDLLSAGG